MVQKKMNMNQWAEEDRPREKMMQKGAAALTNAELLAILIGSGSSDESAVDLMRRLLADCGNSLKVLGRLSLQDMMGDVSVNQTNSPHGKRIKKYKGLGEAKAITILAACELGKRRMAEEGKERVQICSSVDLYKYFLPLMQDLGHEECYVLFMNQAHKVVGDMKVSSGGLTCAVVDIRMVLREAVLRQATTIALCHNHPSGNARPSGEDDRLTEKLQNACSVFDIQLLDHIILTDGNFYSYREEGKLI